MRQPAAPKASSARKPRGATPSNRVPTDIVPVPPAPGAPVPPVARIPIGARQFSALEAQNRPKSAALPIAAPAPATNQPAASSALLKSKKEIRQARKTAKAEARWEKAHAPKQKTPKSQRRSTNRRSAKELPPTVKLTAIGSTAPTVPLTVLGNPVPDTQPQAAPAASVTPIAPRLQTKKHQKHLAVVRKAAIGVGISAVVGGAIWLVGFSPYLALDADRIAIEIPPESLVDPNAVRDLIMPSVGKPLLRMAPGELRDAIGEIPAVKQVEVQRTWPAGLTITIEPRVAVAAVVTDGGFSWIDETGVVLHQDAETSGLIKLEAPLDQPRVLAEMVTIWHGLPPDLQSQISRLSATTSDDITSALVTGQKIRWGSAEQLKLKIATVEALINRAPNSAEFDVSSPALPITR